jgi:putative hydrolase of the HAD superfamily
VTPRALLIDFGGVLTSNVFEAFGDFCASAGLPRDALARAFREDAEAARLLTQVETGALPEREFEQRFAPILCRGTDVVLEPVDGLIGRFSASLTPDEAMLDVCERVRAAGHKAAIVSNSFGYGAYDGYDLDRRFDDVVLSGEVGVRKPSRRIYVLAAARLDVEPGQCVFVDDLAQNVSGAERAGMTGVHHRLTSDTVPRLEALFALDEVPVP